MGRQVQVVMEDEDELEFLSFLRSSAEIRLYESAAPTPEGLLTESFQPRERGHWHYFIWNTGYPWAPELNRVSQAASRRAGWYFHSNVHTAPVIQFCRHNFAPSGVQGRIYWAKSFSAVGPLEYDAVGFSKWFDQIVRWVRKHGRQEIAEAYRPYFFPAALRRCQLAR
jgi:hypothetical protein